MTTELLTEVLAQVKKPSQITIPDWEIILGQARQSLLLGRLARQYADKDWLADIPQGPRNYLEGALRLVDRQHHEVQWEVDCVRRALKDLKTPVVLLKGAAYFMARLPPSTGRLFSDIDIMVARARLPEVEAGGGVLSQRSVNEVSPILNRTSHI